jgi:hypothetical protein
MMINHNATWIDVNEYMPPNDKKKVIVRCVEDNDETFYWGAYFMYEDNMWYLDAVGGSKNNINITHWMKEPAFYPSPSADYIKSEYGDTK